MVKKLRKIIIPLAILSVLVALAIFVSATKFKVENPFAVLNGLCQIAFTDTEYIEIQDYPKVVVAKPQNFFRNLHERTWIYREQRGAIRGGSYV